MDGGESFEKKFKWKWNKILFGVFDLKNLHLYLVRYNFQMKFYR
jgi:hypothetical protein